MSTARSFLYQVFYCLNALIICSFIALCNTPSASQWEMRGTLYSLWTRDHLKPTYKACRISSQQENAHALNGFPYAQGPCLLGGPRLLGKGRVFSIFTFHFIFNIGFVFLRQCALVMSSSKQCPIKKKKEKWFSSALGFCVWSKQVFVWLKSSEKKITLVLAW